MQIHAKLTEFFQPKRNLIGRKIFYRSVIYLAVISLLYGIFLLAYLWTELDRSGHTDLDNAFMRLEPSIARSAWQLDEFNMETILHFFVSMDRVKAARFEDDAWSMERYNTIYHNENTSFDWGACEEIYEFSLIGKKFKGQALNDGKISICITRQADFAVLLLAVSASGFSALLLILFAALGPYYLYQKFVLTPINYLVEKLQDEPIPPRYHPNSKPKSEPDEIDTLYAELHDRTLHINNERNLARNAFEILFDGMAVTDKNFRIERYNPAFISLCEFENKNLDQQDIRNLLPKKCLKNEAEYVEIITQDERVLEIGYHEISELSKFLIVVKDQTERRKMEKQRLEDEKMIALGTLSGGVAHDFNNLLGAIRASAEIMSLDPNIKGDNRELVQEIMHSSDQGARLTAQMLSYASRKEKKTEIVNLGKIIEEVAEMAQRMLGAQHNLSVNIDKECFICTDSSLLETSLINLIVNARDAIGVSGYINLIVRQVPDDFYEGKKYVHIYVQNFGDVIPPKVLNRMLEPYFSTKKAGKGNGLGLFMVDGFVRQFGGSMHISSDSVEGTKIGFHYPVVEASIEGRIAYNPKHINHKALQFNAQILLIDDIDNIRNLTSRLIEAFGVNVTKARSLTEVQQMDESEYKWDLIFCDYALEGDTGINVLKYLNSKNIHVPFYFLTGYMPSDIEKSLHGIKFEGILSKPIDLNTLHEVLSKHCKPRRFKPNRPHAMPLNASLK